MNYAIGFVCVAFDFDNLRSNAHVAMGRMKPVCSTIRNLYFQICHLQLRARFLT